MKSRIILVGPSAAGKNYLRDILVSRGFDSDVSYTTRKRRSGEIDGIDYNFVTVAEFEKMIEEDKFYEYVTYEGTYYGTGREEWETRDVFIMETDGVNLISEEDRKTCFVMYINPPRVVREVRMREERKWPREKVNKRAKEDFKKFLGFKNFDMEITNPEF